MIADLPSLWPPQVRAIDQTLDAIAQGHRRICLTLPTGSGKTRCSWELARDWLVCGLRVAVYTNRTFLIEQLQQSAKSFGLHFGVRSAATLSHNEMPSDDPLQICSIQTEESRTIKKKVWKLHNADRVLIDEAHLQTGEMMQKIVRQHIEAGAYIVGLTASPIGISGMYDVLLQPASISELRDCGALVPAVHYGPDEPDVSSVKKQDWDFTENDVRQIMKVQHIFGRVKQWFDQLNPDRKPTLCFAPGVPESIWLCEELNKVGITAAHIDGEACLYKGTWIATQGEAGQEMRRELRRASQSGELTVICNRFVMREGIDFPWVSHIILATVVGSLSSYLQILGRGLRSYPGKNHCIIQDHGGNWHRHGSANANREWSLEDTEAIVQGMRQELLRRANQDPNAPASSREPFTCPQCAKVLHTKRCSCGFQVEYKRRPVVQEDGSLREHTGDIYRRRREAKNTPSVQERWNKMYFRSKVKKGGRTFRAAMGLFAHENYGQYPPRTLQLMPREDRDLFRLVSEVPRENLF
jgi:DNA repair protein RadD